LRNAARLRQVAASSIESSSRSAATAFSSESSACAPDAESRLEESHDRFALRFADDLLNDWRLGHGFTSSN
jgi:hypothetical protein